MKFLDDSIASIIQAVLKMEAVEYLAGREKINDIRRYRELLSEVRKDLFNMIDYLKIKDDNLSSRLDTLINDDNSAVFNQSFKSHNTLMKVDSSSSIDFTIVSIKFALAELEAYASREFGGVVISFQNQMLLSSLMGILLKLRLAVNELT
jgi:hypothetical protein